MTIIQKKPRDPADSPFVSFNNIGDSVRGVFVKYADATGQWGTKRELHLRDRDGNPRIITCNPDLRETLDGALEDNPAALKGKVITVTLQSLKNTGKANPMKVYQVDATDAKASKPVTTQTEEVSDADEEPPPF